MSPPDPACPPRPTATGHDGSSLEAALGEVPLELSVELGRVTLSLREVAGHLGPGAVLALARLAGEPLDVRVNDRLVARGEAIAVGERYGVRIVELVDASGGKRS